MISLTHVTKLYGQVIGVNDVTVDLERGAHGLLGPNGAGKTTLLGLVTGQLRPTMGRVEVFGERPFSNPSVLSRIGYCPAGDIRERSVTPLQWVSYLVRLSGFTRHEAERRAAAALDQVRLTAAADRPIGTLSKGMRQRAKLAGALAHGPQLLVLDEPFDGLDPVARHDLVSLVKEWATHRSLLVASHLLHEIEPLGAGLVVILGSRVVASGSSSEIRSLIDATPAEVRVVCDKPRQLAEIVCRGDDARSLRFERDDTLIIGTRQAGMLAEQIMAAALDEGIAVREVVPDDRSLEGVFGRLVSLHRGGV